MQFAVVGKKLRSQKSSVVCGGFVKGQNKNTHLGPNFREIWDLHRRGLGRDMSAAKRRGRGRASGIGGSDSPADRSLRQKLEKKQYHDGIESDSDEEGHKQTFSVHEKLQSPKFPMYFVKELRGDELNLEYFQR